MGCSINARESTQAFRARGAHTEAARVPPAVTVTPGGAAASTAGPLHVLMSYGEMVRHISRRKAPTKRLRSPSTRQVSPKDTKRSIRCLHRTDRRMHGIQIASIRPQTAQLLAALLAPAHSQQGGKRDALAGCGRCRESATAINELPVSSRAIPSPVLSFGCRRAQRAPRGPWRRRR